MIRVVTEGETERMFLPDREQLAWAAGFMDGEGTIGTHRETSKSGWVGLNVTVVQTSDTPDAPPDTLVKFQRAIGGLGVIRRRGDTAGRLGKRPLWAFRTNRWADAQAVIAMLWPWLSVAKRAQAKRAIATRRRENQPWPRTHCRAGHPYEPGSYYVVHKERRGQTRQCKACARARQAALRARTKAARGRTAEVT